MLVDQEKASTAKPIVKAYITLLSNAPQLLADTELTEDIDLLLNARKCDFCGGKCTVKVDRGMPLPSPIVLDGRENHEAESKV